MISKCGQMLVAELSATDPETRVTEEEQNAEPGIIAGVGNLIIHSLPTECQIKCHELGVSREKSQDELKIENISAGIYPISFSALGKELSQNIQILPGKTTELMVDFVKSEVTIVSIAKSYVEGEFNEQEGIQNRVVVLPGGVKMEMIWIEPGMFVMGLTEEQKQMLKSQGEWSNSMDCELPAHRVTISRGFWLGKYEITWGQWESVMGAWPWPDEDHPSENLNYPAVYISWNDVQHFVSKLNDEEEKEVYRLPTEAEWEYACRAGTITQWFFGKDKSQLKDYAWYCANTSDIEEEYAHEVGRKLPNPWGLYDMYGNVWEWC